MNLNSRSMTLLELMIAIVLLSLIALGFTSISMFSHMQMVTSDRRAKVQNEISFVLEHMNKQIPQALGNLATDGQNLVVDTRPIGGDNAVSVFVDMPDTITAGATLNTPNGSRDAGDHWIAYRLNQATHELWFCPECNGAAVIGSEGSVACVSCNPVWGTDAVNTLSNRIVTFIPTLTVLNPGVLPVEIGNSIDVDITARWDAGQAATTDNPEITMRSRVKMPSVSIN